MKNKSIWLLILALSVSGSTLLVNTMIVPVPTWVGIICIIISGVSLISFIAIKIRKKR